MKRWPSKPPAGTPCDTFAGTWDTGAEIQRFVAAPTLRVTSRCPNPATETLLPPVGVLQIEAWFCTPCADERVSKHDYRRNPKARPSAG